MTTRKAEIAIDDFTLLCPNEAAADKILDAMKNMRNAAKKQMAAAIGKLDGFQFEKLEKKDKGYDPNWD